MKTSIKKLPHSKIELEITLDAQEFNTYWDNAFAQALSSVQIKGFRPGAAPRELTEGAVDREKVFEQAVERAVRSSLNEAAEEHKFILIDKPKIEVLEATPLLKSIDSKKAGLKYKAEAVI